MQRGLVLFYTNKLLLEPTYPAQRSAARAPIHNRDNRVQTRSNTGSCPVSPENEYGWSLKNNGGSLRVDHCQWNKDHRQAEPGDFRILLECAETGKKTQGKHKKYENVIRSAWRNSQENRSPGLLPDKNALPKFMNVLPKNWLPQNQRQCRNTETSR